MILKIYDQAHLLYIRYFFVNAGKRKGKSLLIDDNVLNWILYRSKRAHGSTRRNIDLALCHLAQNGK